MLHRALIIAFLLMTAQTKAFAGMFPDYDQVSATIFAYNRIGEDTYNSGNLQLEQFEAHIQELADGHYNVAALPDVIDALRSGTPLPQNTVALTFDGGYRSVLTNAVPLLEEHNLPYTLFIPTNLISDSNTQYFSWKDLKTLHKSGLATIGIHSAAYTSIYKSGEDNIRKDLNSAIGDYQKHLGTRPDFFAYPFGDYDDAYAKIVSEYNFKAAFALNSGVAYNGSDIMALPRFAMTDPYGDLERFRMAAQALPVPVDHIHPTSPAADSNPPSIGFNIHSDFAEKIDSITCFANNQTKPLIEPLGENRLELRLDQPFDQGRGRVNCTMPAGQNDDGQMVWRWLGFLFVYEDELLDGSDF